MPTSQPGNKPNGLLSPTDKGAATKTAEEHQFAGGKYYKCPVPIVTLITYELNGALSIPAKPIPSWPLMDDMMLADVTPNNTQERTRQMFMPPEFI
ncbi:hypothetical protein CHS0354_008420 [Potamilus streckersoni]|uniref:Uncharacterized protein n=1 Tax=Potamilus streckersoni TaxID=2493646 RepID=A0AAE0RPV2_9BIVA|nr:hypothetical protein CHS0354_008420 [Potamilus streckersoni]